MYRPHRNYIYLKIYFKNFRIFIKISSIINKKSIDFCSKNISIFYLSGKNFATSDMNMNMNNLKIKVPSNYH